MSNGHARTTGAMFRKVTIQGTTYTLRPFTVSVLPEMEAYIISKREDPIPWASRACMLAPPDQHETIWRVAMEKSIRARAVTEQEMDEFRRTSMGGAWVFWVCARKDHPELKTPEDALAVLQSATEDEMTQLEAESFVASGEADLGNSTGPQAKEGAADQAAGQ